MEEKRDQEELKHVCKLCNKRYPSGKSLGGHMRSHVIANSHKNKPIPPKVINFDDEEDDDIEDEDENETAADQVERDDGKHSGYGLRENPKKTWRMVGSPLKNFNNSSAKQQNFHYQQQQQERVCKQCGKGFQSLKALCGHMSSHSDKERIFKEEDDDYSWSSDSKEQLILATESHSDNNNNDNNISNNHNNCKRQTRSSLSRYRSLATVDSLSPTENGGGSSSNHSEIDQHEQEEVAMCLMMLSRDSSAYKACFNFTAESSDNNSVILEGGSSSNYVGIVGNNNNNTNKRKDFCFMKDNKKKTKQFVAVAKEEEEVDVNHEMDNSDSGYFENGAKELESDDSVDGFARNYGFKKPRDDLGSRLIAESHNYEDDNSRKSSRIREGVNFSFDSPESDENSSKKMMKQGYNNNKGYSNSNNARPSSTKRGSRYDCWVCNKSFKTHQALGGHIISHRKDGENRIQETRISAKKVVATTPTSTKIMPSKAKKVKGHKCPYCPKVFKSGQALGGHKRSHMMGAGSNLGNFNLERAPPPRPEPKLPKQPPLIDLNLPAPMEEEGSGSGGGSGS